MVQQINIKTLFIAAMSAVVILILSYMNFSSAIESKEKLLKLKNSIELSINIAELVHSLQIERGLSIGFLNSKSLGFSDKLQQQIEITDKIFKKLEEIHAKHNIDHHLHKFLYDGLSKLQELNLTRKNVFSSAINTANIIQYYTKINDDFLSAVAQTTISFPLTDVTKMLVSYTNLLYLEELLGQERAIVTSILLNKKCNEENRIALNKLLASETIHKKGFLLYADEETKIFYNKALQSNNTDRVNSIRNHILEAQSDLLANIDPSEWFEVISKKINTLKEVDIYSINKISNLIDSNYLKITTKFYFNMLMGILALFLGIGSFIYFVLKENKRLQELKHKNEDLKLLVDEKTKILQKQKYELEKLVKSFDKNIIFSRTDLNGVITHVSEAFCEACGYSSLELVGSSHNILRHEDMPREVFEDIWSTIKRDACWFGEIKNRKKDASFYWIYAGIEPDYNHAGKHIGYFAISHDITAKKALEIAMQAKSDFLANMSHEIRTPLNAIMGFVDILHKDEKDASKGKKLKIIKDSGVSLLTIINDILDFSKIQNNKLLIEKTPYEIKEAFKQIKELFFQKAREHEVSINLFIDAKLPDETIGDVVRLKQIISNLLSNAIKFSSKDSVVHIKVNYSEENNELYCEINDKGIGISQEKIETIFESFTQEDSSTTRKYGGTGLGLSISKALVELMDGKIGVRSELGVGSSFYFTLPLFHVKHNALEQVCQKDDTVDSSTEMEGYILIVEDNKANQMLMKLLLVDFELEYSIANDGLEAVMAVQKEKFDLILMDENMPKMNGIEASKKIRQLQSSKDIPIIAVTANALKGDKEKFLEAGMNEYLSKPIDADKLKQILRKYLGKKT